MKHAVAFVRYLFVMLFFSVIFFSYKQVAFAGVTTDYQYATGVYKNLSGAWTTIDNVVGPPDGNTAQILNSSALLYLQFTNGFPEIPTGSTVEKIDIKVTFHGTGKWDPFVINTNYGDQCGGANGMVGVIPLNNTSLLDYTTSTLASQCTYLTATRLHNGQIYLRFVRDIGFQSYTVDSVGMRVTYTPPAATVTPTFTPSPTPTPTLAPFLDLPWDYQSKNKTFSQAALNINSFFDHQYPLLSRSSLFPEPAAASGSAINYLGHTVDNYSSHDGYDWGGDGAGVKLGDAVLAAAAGLASYSYSTGSGNTIFIDHGNGYETMYEHLQSDGLIIATAGAQVAVQDRVPIGKVGYTGNVSPSGPSGAHIHFSVVQKKDPNHSFDQDMPDGLTDPFSYASSSADPWPSYCLKPDCSRTGNTSKYLWKHVLDEANAELLPIGASVSAGNYAVQFPANDVPAPAKIAMKAAPTAGTAGSLRSVGQTMAITAVDTNGNEIHQFPLPFILHINFQHIDISHLKQHTFSIYSSPDGTNWSPEQTAIDWANTVATASISHLSYFSLMGEQSDTIAPITTAILSGTHTQQNNWFSANVTATLQAVDADGGSGVDYTLYKTDAGDWSQYTSPLNISATGHHSVDFYSVDKVGNVESVHTETFDIDSPPQITQIPDATLSEGQTYSATGSFSDPDSTGWIASIDYGDGSGIESQSLSGTTFSLHHPYRDNGTYPVSVSITDTQGGTVIASAAILVTNAAPIVGTITGPSTPVSVGIAVSVSGLFTDAGILDAHTVRWEWGDGTQSPGVVTESAGSGTIAGSHTYTDAGVYTVTATVTDKDNSAAAQQFEYVVMYDSTAGFVTGGGQLISPAGALPTAPTLSGDATFGVNAKYTPNNTIPTGSVKFQFKKGDVDFSSTSFDWLVVNGTAAFLSGQGILNDTHPSTFLISVVDGSPDTMRLRIKDSAGVVVYDNQMGASDTTPAAPSIQNGQIKIH